MDQAISARSICPIVVHHRGAVLKVKYNWEVSLVNELTIPSVGHIRLTTTWIYAMIDGVTSVRPQARFFDILDEFEVTVLVDAADGPINRCV